jgi:hypothetical protein
MASDTLDSRMWRLARLRRWLVDAAETALSNAWMRRGLLAAAIATVGAGVWLASTGYPGIGGSLVATVILLSGAQSIDDVLVAVFAPGASCLGWTLYRTAILPVEAAGAVIATGTIVAAYFIVDRGWRLSARPS